MAERGSATEYCALAQGRELVRATPGDRSPPKDKEHEPRREPRREAHREGKHEPHRDAKQEAKQEPHRANGTPLPDATIELPPLIRRQEVVAIALVGLLVIAVTTVLYFGKAFFLPVVMAFVVGTMLSPAANFLERFRIPRSVGAVLIVLAVGALGTFIVGLIAAPAMEWSSRLPELADRLKEKLHVFDRPLALWHELQTMIGGSDALSNLQMPKFEWVQPTLEFLSPTFTEFLLFFVTLVLFIASWKDLRRALIMTFADRVSRLRTLRILNEIEEHLGGYLATVTMINAGVGIATGLICVVAGMPNPAGLGALAATLNYIPIIGPVAMFAVLVVVGLVAFPTLSGAMVAPMLFTALTFFEGHFITPTIIGRRLALNALAVLLALAFWTWLWGPMGGFLSSPLLIVALILKEHLLPVESPQLPDD
jgi:predicted PurR-regulated permease PerM